MSKLSRISVSLLLLVYFALGLGVPLFYLAKEAFVIEGTFSLRYFGTVFQDRLLGGALLNSVNIALGATALALFIAFPLANIMVRVRIPGRRFWEPLIIAPLFLPPFVGILGLRQFLGRSGTINLWLDAAGLIDAPIDFLGSGAAAGIAVVQALHLYPLVYLSAVAALSSLNRELEEAAISAGAGTMARYVRIVMPLLMPSLVSSALLVFVGSFTDVGTPLLFEYRNAVPVLIFNSLSDLESSGPGYALVCLVGLLAMVLFTVARFFESGAPGIASGRSFRSLEARSISPGRDTAALLFVAGVSFVSLVPHFGVVLQAFSDHWFMTALPDSVTVSHFEEVFAHPVAFGSLRYSILLGLASTALTFFVALAVAWRSVRARGRYTGILESIAMLPLAVPGIVIAFGYIIGFAETPIDNRVNPTPLLVLAYSVRKLPFMLRLLISGLRSSSVDLEQAGRVFGASPARIVRRITVPLLLPAIIAGSVLSFLGSLLEVSDSLLLAMEERYFPIAKALYMLQGRPDGPPVACALAIIVMGIVAGGMYAASRWTGKPITQLMKVA